MIEEIQVLIRTLYYEDNLQIQQIIENINETYNIDISVEDINNIIMSKPYKVGRSTKRYRNEVASTVIVQWFKKGYTIEQIREEADKMKLQVPEENIKQAEIFYKELCEKKHNKKTKVCEVKNNEEEGR